MSSASVISPPPSDYSCDSDGERFDRHLFCYEGIDVIRVVSSEMDSLSSFESVTERAHLVQEGETWEDVLVESDRVEPENQQGTARWTTPAIVFIVALLKHTLKPSLQHIEKIGKWIQKNGPQLASRWEEEMMERQTWQEDYSESFDDRHPTDTLGKLRLKVEFSVEGLITLNRYVYTLYKHD